MARSLTRMFGLLSEDRVATRALSDIIGKAIQSGGLSDLERHWADKLVKAIEKSGPDQLVYPKLHFEPTVRKPAHHDAPVPGGSDDELGLGRMGDSPKGDPEMAKAQSVWDMFGKFPTKPQGDVELGPAGAAPSEPEAMPARKKGALSRIFNRKPDLAKAKAAKPKKAPRPGKGVSQSTWDDLSHGRGREPEDRR